MRFAPGRPWLPFRAEQWFPGSGIDFRWQAWIYMAPFMPARVVDSFDAGRGNLTARLLGFVPVAQSRGPATDRGEALRGLAELPWRPFAFSQAQCFTWETAGNEKMRVAFDDGRTQAAIEFEVDGEGHVLGGAASSRPRIVGKSVVETAWSGAFGDYRIFDRIRIPTVAEVAWHLPEGPFTYWRGRVVEFRILQ